MNTDIDSLMLKAKIELMTRSVFISTIALSAKHIITDSVPTAATNGTKIYYNPDFIAKQTVQELAGLIAHECWHIAFQHIARRGSRDPAQWNYAGDYVINLMLTKAGMQIPSQGLLDKKYEGLATDEVYNLLKDENKDIDPSNMIMDIMGDPEEGEGEDGTSQSDVIDILVRAHTQAKLSGDDSAGSIPGEILRVIDELINPKMPWPVLLNRFLDQRVREEYSWARRNRRHSVYLPSLHSYGLGHLTFAIDLSGSIDDDELQEVLSEIKGIRDTMCPEKMTVIGCDTRITEIHEVDTHTDILGLKFTGGGGTSFLKVLEYVEENPTQALVYFTDLYGEENLDPVDYPVMWICNSDHKPSNIGETIYIDNNLEGYRMNF